MINDGLMFMKLMKSGNEHEHLFIYLLFIIIFWVNKHEQ
jgi:hypothetical protein